ncbi:MAG TPA: FHA domain-containing protein [Gammaproteobacteria bacterium]|nr:FHA domain-containing protein [Gammaproteobacteria bacterium]
MAEARFVVSPAKVFARPTADQVWLGPAQQAALSQLSRTMRVRALLGPPSSGKTTLLNHLASRLGANAVVLHLKGPKNDASGVLASLLLNAGLAPWELSEIEQRNLLSVFVQQRRSQGRRVLVVIDDAHSLQPAAWDEVERLLAFRVEQRPAIDLLLAGSPSFGHRLPYSTDSETVRHILETPSQADLASYVEWRLARFDMGGTFTPVASEMIVRLSEGRFAAVDVLCQMALLLLRQLRVARVDARIARRAIAKLAAQRTARVEDIDGVAGSSPREEPPCAYLLVSRGGRSFDKVTLAQRTLLGRSEHNDVCLPSAYLSRHHAAIVGTPEGYYVVDLNSANGLSLNGRHVERAVLRDQDVLTLGPFKIMVQIPERVPRGDPHPEDASLVDTAMLPAPATPDAPSAVRLVK